jgi:hypothetical protein
MPWSERAIVVALCGIALVVLVVWLVRSVRSGAAGPPIEVRPPARAAGDRLQALYAKYGWDDAADDEGDVAGPPSRTEPPGH